MRVELSVEQDDLRRLVAALSELSDGKALRRELAKNLRDAVRPVVPEIQRGLMAVHSVGHGDGSLRSTVAKGVTVAARLTQRSTGATIKVKRTPGLRGFSTAGRLLNRSGGWRHPVFGMDVWVAQKGNPGYFNNPINARRDQLRRAVVNAMEDMATRIATRVQQGA